MYFLMLLKSVDTYDLPVKLPSAWSLDMFGGVQNMMMMRRSWALSAVTSHSKKEINACLFCKKTIYECYLCIWFLTSAPFSAMSLHLAVEPCMG